MNILYWIPVSFLLGIVSALVLTVYAFKREFGYWPWEDK